MRACPDCGCRVYGLGCVNCHEEAYIEEQAWLDDVRREPTVLAVDLADDLDPPALAAPGHAMRAVHQQLEVENRETLTRMGLYRPPVRGRRR